MWVEVTPMRQNGRLNPRWKWGADLCLGRLHVAEQHDPAVRRWVRVATLHTHDLVELMPPLRDVVLLQIEGAYLVLSGYQHNPLVGTGEPALVGQTWAVHTVSEAQYREWHRRQAAEGRLPRAPLVKNSA